MPNLKPTELIILLVVLILLFGAKKLPDAARGIGRSLRIFKADVKAQDEIVVEDDKNTETKP